MEMKQSDSSHQQTLTSMLMEAVKAASSSKNQRPGLSTPPTGSSNTTSQMRDNIHFQQNSNLSSLQQGVPSNQQTLDTQSSPLHSLNTINAGMGMNDCNTTSSTSPNGQNNYANNGMMDSSLVLQMMRMMMANDSFLNSNQQSMVSTSTINQANNSFTLSSNSDSIEPSMMNILLNTTMNNATISQLNHLFSNFLLTNTATNTGQESSHSQLDNTMNNASTNNIDSKKCNSMSPSFDQVINSPQFFDNGCSTHVFIKKGVSSKRRNQSNFSDQPWYRLLVKHQASPSEQDDRKSSIPSTSHQTKVVNTNRCMIGVDCYYYLLIVLPSKMCSLADLEFHLEEDNICTEGKKKKKKSSSISAPIEIKIRGKDLTSSTKLKHFAQSLSYSSSSSESTNLIAIFEIMANRKRAKAGTDSSYNVHVNCKQEKLIKMSIDVNESGSIDNCTDEEMLDLVQQEIDTSQKKRKKGSLLFDEEIEHTNDSFSDPTRKRSKSNGTTVQEMSLFDQLKQWIIVTVFHESLSVDLSKFPNFAFPKELSLNEGFLLYVDVPTQLSEFHDICFKILDAESKQELSFNGEKWIDTNVVNCCNFNIQASLVSLHVEYSISFRDINHERPLVFVVALKDKNTEEERIIYNGSPFKIRKQVEPMDELGISTIQCSGFETLTVEPTTISEIFDEIPILNSESLFSEVSSPTMSANFVPPSESDILDDFERFLDM